MVSETRFSQSADYHLRHRAEEYSFREQAQAVVHKLSARDSPVLDLGCGTGPLAPTLHAAGLELRGVDLDFAMLQGAVRRPGCRPGHFLLADARGLPFRDGAFGAVVSLGLFEYLPEPVAAMGEIHRVLRPGGRFHMTVPRLDAPYRRALTLVSPVVAAIRRPDPFDLEAGRPPRREDVAAWAARSGFGRLDCTPVSPQVLPWPFDRLAPRLALALAGRAGPPWATVELFTMVRSGIDVRVPGRPLGA
jgi:SAM-dependent methyltransferase